MAPKYCTAGDESDVTHSVICRRTAQRQPRGFTQHPFDLPTAGRMDWADGWKYRRVVMQKKHSVKADC